MGSAQLTKIMISSSSITSASSRAMFAIRSSFSYNNIPRNYTQLRVLTSKSSSVLLCNNNNHNHLRRQGGRSGKPSSSYISLPSLITPRSLCCSATTNDEETSAKAAAASADTEEPTIFDKIIAKEIPSTIVYEDDKVLAFRDINPQAPVHVLVIPKFRDSLTKLAKAEPRHNEILGYLLYAAKIVAEKEGILEGFRVVINNGPSACQSVYHLHLHVLGGRQMKWPAG